MPGSWITDHQVEKYMKTRRNGATQVASSLKAGISERSGREIEHARRLNPRSKIRKRTQADPLEVVWEGELKPMLEKEPELQPMTLLEYLQNCYVDAEGNPRYPDKVLRTLQRRVKAWKATEGPKQEVMFRQRHDPGQQGLSDFTKLKGVRITIKGKELIHLLYHFRLIYSRWSYVKVILGGESYTALTEGLQEALWRLGGSPLEHRTDSLSAAFKNLNRDAKRDITERYEQFCKDYQMKATRNNPGAKHENGGVESPHGHIKRRIEQALLLRGSNDFESVEAYQKFVEQAVNQHNRRNAKAIQVEREYLQPLPSHKSVDYTEVVARVTSSSTIVVRHTLYTVPSQLVGETLRIRLYHDRLYCYLGSKQVHQLRRMYPKRGQARTRQIDYRHVIHSLVKKPQAFRYSQIRDDLLPNDTYKTIWEHVNDKMEARQACKFIVGLLYLASKYNCEEELGKRVLHDIARSRQLALPVYQAQFIPAQQHRAIDVKHHKISDYNDLISREIQYA